MKKSKNIVLIVTPVLSAALLNACGGNSRQPYPLANTAPIATPNPLSTVPAQTAQTRDVYNSLDDCVRDWLDKEVCEQMSEDDDLYYRKLHKTSRKGRYFYGPGYSSGNRIFVYKGKTLSPTGKVTSKMPTFVSSAPSKTTTGSTTSSSTRSSTSPSSSSTSKSTTSSSSSSTTTPYSSSSSTTTPYSSSSSTTNPYSSSSSSSTTSPYSSSSSTTRGGFGSTSSYSSSSRSSSSSGS